MFNIGGGEILVILLVALIVLGPQRLPEAARKVGSVIGEVRRMANSFEKEIKTAFDDLEGNERPSARSKASTTDVGTAARLEPAAASPPSALEPAPESLPPEPSPPSPPAASSDNGSSDAVA